MELRRKIKILLVIFYLGFIIIPLFNIIFKVKFDLLCEIIFNIKFLTIFSNSVLIAFVATSIVMILSYLAAYVIERTEIKLKSIFKLIFIITMLIPSFSCAMGLIILFGNNGIITKLLNFNIGIYGFKGLVLGEILYSFPVAFLMFDDILKYENYTIYEEAKVLGIDKYSIFKGITLPYLKRPIISIAFCVFTLVITDYGIPLIIGGKISTIPLYIYQEVLGQQDFQRGICYSIILLIIALISSIFDIFNRDTRVITKFKKFKLKTNNLKFYYLYCIIISICIILPIFSFIFIVDFDIYKKIMADNFIKYLSNSVISSFVSSFVGTFFSFITAYIVISGNKISNRVIHLFAIFSLAVPGLVLGLSYAIFFNNTFIYSTLLIIIIVNIVHFISSPYLMAYNSLLKTDINLNDQSVVLGISEFRYIKDILIPLNRQTLIEMFSFYFVNCMMTISAVSFLSNINTRPLSLLINQYQEQMQLGASALVAFIILLINLLVKLFLNKLSIIKLDNI